MVSSVFLALFSHIFARNASIPDVTETEQEREPEIQGHMNSRKSIWEADLPNSDARSGKDGKQKPLLRTQSLLLGSGPYQRASVEDSNPNTPYNAGGVRFLPLISSVFVPFAILLAIPGFTEHRYIQTNNRHQIVDSQKNPLYIQAILGFSMACAIITNLCLLVRLFERRVKTMTLICIISLTIHDILDTIVIIMFIVKTQEDDGFILGQAFWMTLCSTIASLVTNITLIVDFRRNPGDERHKSGLTEKQRSLTILIIVLLCYVAFGAAVYTSLMDLSFINALYFTVVCIETVGFGDINPQSVGARIFSSAYTAVGIVILAVAIGFIREAILEAIQLNLYSRIRRARKQRIMARWIAAIKWRLDHAHLPLWLPVDENDAFEWPREMETRTGGLRRFLWRWSRPVHRSIFSRDSAFDQEEIELPLRHRTKKMRLNIRALSEAQLRAAAMEAGAPLNELLPRHPDHDESPNHPRFYSDDGSDPVSPTHHRMGRMISVIGHFAFAVSVGQNPSRTEGDEEGTPSEGGGAPSRTGTRDDLGVGLTVVELEREEKRMFAIRITFALGLFFTFWLVGSAIFTVFENWSFGLALYFCFITFSTVGYGDPVPKTPAGRSFFVGWALCGIATMAILISLLADRYSERYKNMIFVAESSIVADETKGSGERHKNSPTEPQASSTSRVTFSERNSSGNEKPLSIGGEVPDIFKNQEVLSRLNSLRSLVVDEGAHKEGRLVHTLESELQSMLLLIRRARKEPPVPDK